MKVTMLHAETDKVQIKTGEFLINDSENTVVTAALATLNDCLSSLPDFFNAGLLSTGGTIVCEWMKNLSKDYVAGPWNFYLLSNGGFYMAPQITSKMKVEASGHFYDYEAEVSSNAAGIIATLFAFDSLEEIFPGGCVSDLYRWLLEYVNYHPESSEIYRAIFRT